MLTIDSKGNYRQTINYLKDAQKDADTPSVLDKYGQIGVERLSKATPVLTGKTADSWEYDIVKTNSGYKINFYNTNQNEGYHIVILLQYGHVTSEGTWVEGNDFVSPIIKQLCDEMTEEI